MDGGAFSSRVLGTAADKVEDILAKLRQSFLADPSTAEESRWREWLVAGDRSQGLVVEDRPRRFATLLRDPPTPTPQMFKQFAVNALPVIGICLGGLCLPGTGGEEHDLLVATEHLPGRLRKLDHWPISFAPGQQPLVKQLMHEVFAAALVKSCEESVGRQLIMTMAFNAFGLGAPQHLADMPHAKPLLNTVDTGEDLLSHDSRVGETLGFSKADIAGTARGLVVVLAKVF